MASERAFLRDIGGELHTRLDAALAGLASRQHGVVARWQLTAFGDDAIDHRIAAGRLHRIHRGVYAVGHSVLSMRGHWHAAVLTGGPGTVLSHRAAAGLWDLRNTRALEGTSPRPLRRPGIITHRATLPPDEVTTRGGIPTTTAART